MTTDNLPPCRACGGHLQRVASMPDHVVCGSGHLYLEDQAASSRESAAARVRRTSEAAAAASRRAAERQTAG